VPIADEKSKGPVTNLVFLGIEIYTIEMVIQIPHEKLIRLKSLLVTRTPVVEKANKNKGIRVNCRFDGLLF
jgi:hypothetical protein